MPRSTGLSSSLGYGSVPPCGVEASGRDAMPFGRVDAAGIFEDLLSDGICCYPLRLALPHCVDGILIGFGLERVRVQASYRLPDDRLELTRRYTKFLRCTSIRLRIQAVSAAGAGDVRTGPGAQTELDFLVPQTERPQQRGGNGVRVNRHVEGR